MSKRVFVFGCSMTSYNWLTWADVLFMKYIKMGYQCYNLGLSGTGNNYIFHSLIRANYHYKFTSEDIIMVMWSSWNRLDHFSRLYYNYDPTTSPGPWWIQHGNVLNSEIEMDKMPDHLPSTPISDYVNTIWSLENDITQSISCTTAANKMFDIAFQGSIFPMESAFQKDVIDDIILDTMNTVFNDNMPRYMCENSPTVEHAQQHHEIFKLIENNDGHPPPITAYDWIAKHQHAQLGLDLADEKLLVVDYVSDLLTYLSENYPDIRKALEDKSWRVENFSSSRGNSWQIFTEATAIFKDQWYEQHNIGDVHTDNLWGERHDPDKLSMSIMEEFKNYLQNLKDW